MKLTKIRIFETFVTLIFPVALVVGCGSQGEDSTREAALKNGAINTSNVSAPTPPLDQTPPSSQNSRVTKKNSDTSHTVLHSLEENHQQFIETNYKTPEHDQTPVPEIVRIHFKFNQRVVDESYHTILQQHALYLISHPQVQVNINGYCDSSGPTKYNLTLSKQRAQSVADLLSTFGVAKSQMKINGLGESQAKNSATNRKESRRVELQFTTTQLDNRHIVRAD